MEVMNHPIPPQVTAPLAPVRPQVVEVPSGTYNESCMVNGIYDSLPLAMIYKCKIYDANCLHKCSVFVILDYPLLLHHQSYI